MFHRINFLKFHQNTSSFIKYFYSTKKLEDLTLVDRFQRHHSYLRISLTEKCNLRCQYCMPAEGVNLSSNDKLLTKEEIIYLAKIFISHGVNKIRLTGGEPTLRKDLPDIIKNLKQIPGLETLAMTTNGLVLKRRLNTYKQAGLDILNISLDTLKDDLYTKMTRRPGLHLVLDGIETALNLGYNPVKINVVLMRGVNEDELLDFVQLTKDKPLDIRFIEYMPFSGNGWSDAELVPFREAVKTIQSRWPEFIPITNAPNDTSKAYKVPGFKGQVGFITSMTENFCSTCNRIRLTADGNLKVCLFGNREVSLRDAIRAGVSEDDLSAIIQAAILRKHRQHAGYTQSKMTVPMSASYYIQKNIFLQSVRLMSSKALSHVDPSTGKAQMVDVGGKEVTFRRAIAEGSVVVGSEIIKLISQNEIKKGDVLTVAQLAGIMAAKRTSELIPLCHPIPLTNVKIYLRIDVESESVLIKADVKCEGKTGVEMEALTAVSVAALTIYDMCKGVSHEIEIRKINLLSKSGGRSGTYHKKI